MQRHLSRLIGRVAVPVFGGAALGGVAAVAYVAVCGALYWALTGRADRLPSLVLRFATAGAIAGGLMGFMLALDWAKTGRRQASSKPEKMSLDGDGVLPAEEVAALEARLGRADHDHVLCGNGSVLPAHSGLHEVK